MKRDEALKLKAGDRVVYQPGGADEAHGEVAGLSTAPGNYAALHVDWDDGQKGSVHADDMSNFELTS